MRVGRSDEGGGEETELGFWQALGLGCGCEWTGWADFRADCRLMMGVEKSMMGLQSEAEMAEDMDTRRPSWSRAIMRFPLERRTGQTESMRF